MNNLSNPSGCLHLGYRKRKTTMRKIAALLLSVLSFGASAQHAVTVTKTGNDLGTITVVNNGLTTISAAEIFTGPALTGRAIFNASGTEGDLDFPYWASSTRFSVLTWSLNLQPGEQQTFNVNFDQVGSGDLLFGAEATGLNAYVGLRMIPVWADGFDTYLPMSHSPHDAVAVFTFTDIAPAVPEPGQTAMLLAGLGVLGFVARKGGVK